MNTLPRHKQFNNGQMIQYNEPNITMRRAFGLRVYECSPKSNFLNSTAKKVVDARPGIGMVAARCFVSTHGAGTWYYKVLLSDNLYWIASEHLNSLSD